MSDIPLINRLWLDRLWASDFSPENILSLAEDLYQMPTTEAVATDIAARIVMESKITKFIYLTQDFYPDKFQALREKFQPDWDLSKTIPGRRRELYINNRESELKELSKRYQ